MCMLKLNVFFLTCVLLVTSHHCAKYPALYQLPEKL